MTKTEEVMEVLEAYDLTGSFGQAAALVGCDHKTVAYWVRHRDEAGGMPALERAPPAMEAVFAAKIDELVDRSRGETGRTRRTASWLRFAHTTWVCSCGSCARDIRCRYAAATIPAAGSDRARNDPRACPASRSSRVPL